MFAPSALDELGRKDGTGASATGIEWEARQVEAGDGDFGFRLEVIVILIALVLVFLLIFVIFFVYEAVIHAADAAPHQAMASTDQLAVGKLARTIVVVAVWGERVEPLGQVPSTKRHDGCSLTRARQYS